MSDETKGGTEVRDIVAPPSPPAQAGDPLLRDAVMAMVAMNARHDPRPALPDPNAFKANRDTYVVDRDGNKVRHGRLPEGQAEIIGHVNDKSKSDDKNDS